MKNRSINQRIVNFLFEAGTLRKIARAHRQTLLTDDLSDNIASHSFRVTIIGYFLAVEEKVDITKVILMCLFHDIAEARSGDRNWVQKKYSKVFNEELLKDQLQSLPFSSQLVNLALEYGQRRSHEARVAKDADLLDQILLLKEYSWNGNQEAGLWLEGKEQEKNLKSKSAKELAKIIYKSRPSQWWDDHWTSQNR